MPREGTKKKKIRVRKILTLDKRIINEMMHSPYIDGAH